MGDPKYIYQASLFRKRVVVVFKFDFWYEDLVIKDL